MSIITDIRQAIGTYVRPDHCVALEGFTHLIPHAAALEIIRQGITDLHLVRMTPDVIYDWLIGAGAASKLTFSWGGNPGVGSLHRFREAYEKAIPHKMEFIEHAHAAMANAFAAGASGLPCAVFKGYTGTSYPDVNPNIKFLQCPFTNETLTAVPALNPDVAIVHAQKADRKGNVWLKGIVGVQKEAVLAAKESIVTVEEIVDEVSEKQGGVVIPHWLISAVCEIPNGAFPSYAEGYYDRNNSFYIRWDEISRDYQKFQDWIETYVKSASGYEETFSRLKEDGYV